MNDLRHALRLLLKTPGFSTAATLTLAFAIGPNTAAHGAASAQVSGWSTGSPEEVGLDSVALNEMFDFVR